MMKKKLVYIAAVFGLLLPGCSREEIYRADTPDASPAILSLQVETAGYRSPAETLASDTGIENTFTNGDQLGVIVTHTDNTMEHAVYTYNGSAWTSTTPVYYDYQDQYAAYYPYREDLYGKTLEEIKTVFTPQTDQSDYATGYAASDLMTCASAALNENKVLQVTLAHEFTLLRMVGNIKFKCMNNETYEYTVPVSGASFQIGDVPYWPWIDNEGCARLIVRSNSSNTSVQCSYAFRKAKNKVAFSVSDPSAGNYYTLNAQPYDIGDYDYTDVQTGDFYMKSDDGNSGFVFPGEASSLPDALQSACAGVVFWVGDIATDNDDPLLKTSHSGCTHGLVAALHDASDNTSLWSVEYEDITSNWLNNQSITYGITTLKESNKMQGYANTKTLEGYNASSNATEANSGKKVLPIGIIETYADSHPAPTNSSGWYWPSVKELKYMCWGQNATRQTTVGRDMLNRQFAKVEGTSSLQSSYYWSSTEYDYRLAWYVRFNDGYVYLNGSKYYNSYYLRAVLAF